MKHRLCYIPYIEKRFTSTLFMESIPLTEWPKPTLFLEMCTIFSLTENRKTVFTIVACSKSNFRHVLLLISTIFDKIASKETSIPHFLVNMLFRDKMHRYKSIFSQK